MSGELINRARKMYAHPQVKLKAHETETRIVASAETRYGKPYRWLHPDWESIARDKRPMLDSAPQVD